MECSVAGISFRVKDNAEIGKLKPSGMVELVHDPDNKFDKLAVEVVWEGNVLGFLPAASEARKAFFECKESGLDIGACIKDYCYATYDGGKIITGTFNNNHEGMLASVTLNVSAGITSETYIVNDEEYLRASSVAHYQDDVGFPLPQPLFNWQKKFKTYKDYLDDVSDAGDDGTKKHNAIELFFRDGVEHPDLPKGIKELGSLYSIEYVDSEKVVVDHDIKVAGKYDMKAFAMVDAERMLVMFDWKRSKKLSFAYMLQVAFYAKKTGCDVFWVVLLGTENKCGYSIKSFGKADIEELYECFCNNARAMRIARKYKQFRG